MVNIGALRANTHPHTPVKGKRPILFRRFPDGSAYTFNVEYPSGVFYLRSAAADRLEGALRVHGNPPNADICSVISRSPAEETLLRKLIDPQHRPALRPAERILNVWFHISNSCNLSCNYCYIPELRKAVTVPEAGSLSTPEELTAAITSLFALCANRGFRGLRLRFAGGEPLLALREIERACEIAVTEAERTGLALTFGILTNGTIMPNEFLHLLDRYPFKGISISIDGTKSVHDEYRFQIQAAAKKRAGTWNRIFENIRVLKDAGHSPYILTTLTAANYTSIDEFVDTCIDRRLGFRLSPIRDNNSARIPGLQEAILNKLQPIYERLPFRLPITRPIQNYANFAEWSPGVKKSTACGTCRSSFAVGQHGDVSTCQMRLDTRFGNIATASAIDVFDRMVSDPANWRFTTPTDMTGGCSDCMWRYSCSGGCPEHTMSTYKTYDAPSPWCKLYGDFLPVYLHAIATQIKIAADPS